MPPKIPSHSTAQRTPQPKPATAITPNSPSLSLTPTTPQQILQLQRAVGNAGVRLLVNTPTLQRMDMPLAYKADLTGAYGAAGWNKPQFDELLASITQPDHTKIKATVNGLKRIVANYTYAQWKIVNTRQPGEDLIPKGAPQLAETLAGAQWLENNVTQAAALQLESIWNSMPGRAKRHAEGLQDAPTDDASKCRHYANAEGRITTGGGNWIEWYVNGHADQRRYFTQWNTGEVWWTDKGTHDPMGAQWWRRAGADNWRRAHVGYQVN